MTSTFYERANRLPPYMGMRLEWLKFYIQGILFVRPIIVLALLGINFLYACTAYTYNSSDYESTLYAAVMGADIIGITESIICLVIYRNVRNVDSIQAYQLITFSVCLPIITSFVLYITQVAPLSQLFSSAVLNAVYIPLNIVYLRKRKGLFDGTAFNFAQNKPPTAPYTTVTPSNSKFTLNISEQPASEENQENVMPSEQIPASTNSDKTDDSLSLDRLIVDTVMKSIGILQEGQSFTDAQKAETAIFAKMLFYQYVSKDITAHCLAFARLVKELKENSDMPEEVIANIMRMRETEYMKLLSAENFEAVVLAYVNDIADLGGSRFDKDEFYARVQSFVKEVQK